MIAFNSTVDMVAEFRERWENMWSLNENEHAVVHNITDALV